MFHCVKSTQKTWRYTDKSLSLRHIYTLDYLFNCSVMKQNEMKQQKKSYFPSKGIKLEIRASKTQKKQIEAEKKRKMMEKYQKDINKRWMLMETTNRYRVFVAKEVCGKTTDALKSELLDGLFINLRERNSSKSDKEQVRLVRRIVEKRQAQAAHHKIGRTKNLYTSKVTRRNTCECMMAFRKQMFCLLENYSN